MRFLVIGAGAIGTYIGGSLALAKHEVAILARPATAQKLRANGLRLQMGPTTHPFTPSAIFETPAAALATPPDCIIFALKSYDTAGALAELRAVTQTPPPLWCLQNGVDNEGAIAAIFGAERVIAGTVTTAVGKLGPGQVAVEKLRGVGVSLEHPLGAALAQALTEAGLQTQSYPQTAPMKWSKLLTNLVGNTTAAILDMPVAAIFADPALFQLERAMLRECLAVMRALRLPVVDLPRTPVRLLALALQLEPAWLMRPLLQRSIGSGRGNKMPSFHIDLHTGNGQTEVQWLNGAVVKHGQARGVPTPVNQALTDILLKLSAGQLAKAQFKQQPTQLLAAVAQHPLPG